MLEPVAWAVMAAAVVVTVVTGVDYAVRAARLRRTSQRTADRARRGSASSTPADILGRLAARRETLAVAESLTGGLLCASFVSVPGASDVLRGGVVAYATDLKHDLLDVPADDLAADGAVHPRTALAMASGVARRLGASWGLATTGVAGPAAQEGHPPGTCHVAVSGPGVALISSATFSGGRDSVRRGAVAAALVLLGQALDGNEPAAPTG